jgi:hypothetical protein
MKTSQSREVPL